MKYIIASYCFLFCVSIGFSQRSPISKPIIDSAAINYWPGLSGTRAISNDGKYFMYSIDNQPIGSNRLIIKSTEGSWQKEFIGISTGVFSGDNKEFLYQNADTLFFLSLGKDGLKKIPGVTSYSQPPNGKGRWLVYQLNDENKELIIHDFKNNQEKHFNHVKAYAFDDAMRKILMTTDNGLEWASLNDGKVSSIWLLKDHPGLILGGYAMDKEGTQVSFLTTEIKDSVKVNTIWYFNEAMTQAEIKVTNGSKGIESGLNVSDNAPGFSGDGQTIFFQLTSNQETRKPITDAVSVDVWNWQDSILQSKQLTGPEYPRPWFSATIGTTDKNVIQLEYENDQIRSFQAQGNYVVVGHNNNSGDRFWLDKADSYFLVSVHDGSRIPLTIKSSYSEFYFSPDGEYVVYYDLADDGPFLSYDLKTGRVRNISAGIPAHWLRWDDGFERFQDNKQLGSSVGLGGWDTVDTALLVYDNYDIWKLSLAGGKAAVNITQGYGRSHHIRLRVAKEDNGLINVYQQTDSLLLVAFGTQNKYNGFYRQALTGNGNPVLLSMGPWTIFHVELAVGSVPFNNASIPPLKAEDADSWVVLRMTATEAPNYFLTHNFKNYQALTDLAPEKQYNWLTTELVSWVQPDGITSQGVLYKPEDFDSHKKYPVIISYYEQLSHRLYEYPQPGYTDNGQINIPWFVSRGYLVFTPDIYYHEYAMTPSACTTVESAGKMLAKLPYVDSKRMGISGHSWGGAETNYIVTHTHLFAAALSGGAGHSGVDLISNSLSLTFGIQNSLSRYELQDVGTTLWQRPDLWIKQSPIFQADQVTTPFLIFYNKADNDWLRALEFFIALRRLEKHVWMLQYDNYGHSVDGKAAEDFTIRVTQFFDHYLKGEPMPVWMSKGIRAADKMVKNGLELDTSTTAP